MTQRANGKSRGGTQSFAGIPRAVLDHPAFFRLSPIAVRLLLEFARQYRGRNNGNLTCAWEVLRLRGWRSKATIQKARDELLRADFIRCTRQGQFLNPGGKCALYALTWLCVDECPGKNLELRPTLRPLRIFATATNCEAPGLVSGRGSTQLLGREAPQP